MRLYGGRILKQHTERQIARSQELRNAVIIDVDTTGRYCRVKIQGSSTLIKAWYPENWEQTPNYLKPGNAVLITHPGGNRGRIEISGNGILLPTSTINAPIVPTPTVLPDTVLTGCTLSASNPESMSVRVKAGTYRINEVVYTLNGMQMDDATIEMDRFDLEIDSGDTSVSFDAASATKYRYDSVTVGADGIIDVIKGSYFSAGGTIPDPPVALTDHLRLGFVLIPPNTTAINGGLVNKYYTAPQPTVVAAVLGDSELSWSEPSTTISVSVKDQYGNYYPHPDGSGWHFTISWQKGNGTLSYGGESTDESGSLSFFYSGPTAAVVTYTRNKDSGDESPLFVIAEDNPLTGTEITYIQLLNVSGEKII